MPDSDWTPSYRSPRLDFGAPRQMRLSESGLAITRAALGLRGMGSIGVAALGLRGMDSIGVAARGLRGMGSVEEAALGLRGMGSIGVAARGLRGMGSVEVALWGVASNKNTTKALLGMSPRDAALRATRDMSTRDAVLRATRGMSTMEAALKTSRGLGVTESMLRATQGMSTMEAALKTSRGLGVTESMLRAAQSIGTVEAALKTSRGLGITGSMLRASQGMSTVEAALKTSRGLGITGSMLRASQGMSTVEAALQGMDSVRAAMKAHHGMKSITASDRTTYGLGSAEVAARVARTSCWPGSEGVAARTFRSMNFNRAMSNAMEFGRVNLPPVPRPRSVRIIRNLAATLQRLEDELSRKNRKTEEQDFRILTLEEERDEQRILLADHHQVLCHLVHARITDLLDWTDQPVERIVESVFAALPDGVVLQDLLELRDNLIRFIKGPSEPTPATRHLKLEHSVVEPDHREPKGTPPKLYIVDSSKDGEDKSGSED